VRPSLPTQFGSILFVRSLVTALQFVIVDMLNTMVWLFLFLVQVKVILSKGFM
jgi:hypothetical protein